MTTSQPMYSLCQLAFPDTTIEQDIEIALATGAAGLSIDENKIMDRRPEDVARRLKDAGLAATACVPSLMSFLPGEYTPGPEDPGERVKIMSEGVKRLAVLEPSSILCLTGPRGDLPQGEARARAAECLHALAETADSVGVPLSFESFRFAEPQNYSVIFGIDDALAFLDEAGRPDVPLCYDIWHLWGSSDRLIEQTREIAPRVNVVQLNDVREPTRSWNDRVLPGDGVADLPAILRALREGGFDGWYDLEVFSDDGRWGNDYPDSVWKLPWEEQARRGHDGLLRAWEASFDSPQEA
jgi:sugar phosphate isomerase/epimerase